ncbi:hypothetical protein COU77_00675 [Candidatus Peregrinibacteria bacterium CG10_big_fil_rev_8_21_14_0_10_49_16]|nr:MAG: hypothetical protein COW95_04620 [Candidatus Peregrinibacteria bacterium CG22_combo_CG10-13_8_21_14_all_49_11]PIR52378.1 MAG: hypothetical protein COU77_00675 [Candidatus Peregrinibacteria bacterium CG10_big_fil_rev_8_21_14_0_10_49_16]
MSGQYHQKVLTSTLECTRLLILSHPILLDLGLSPNEAKLYYALLQYGGSGVSTISLRAKVHRRNAYDAIQRLLEKGLVFELYGGKETVYEAVEPGKLLELVHEKEDLLERALPEFRKLYHAKKLPEKVYIYKGVNGVKNYMREALRLGEDMYRLGAEGAWADPRLRSYTDHFAREAKRKKMKIHAIFDHEAKDIPDLPTITGATEWKFLDKKYDNNSTMDVFGDYVVTYTGTAPGKLLDDVTVFVMFSPDLAESFRIWWQCLWDMLPKEKKVKRKSF